MGEFKRVFWLFHACIYINDKHIKSFWWISWLQKHSPFECKRVLAKPISMAPNRIILPPKSLITLSCFHQPILTTSLIDQADVMMPGKKNPFIFPSFVLCLLPTIFSFEYSLSKSFSIWRSSPLLPRVVTAYNLPKHFVKKPKKTYYYYYII